MQKILANRREQVHETFSHPIAPTPSLPVTFMDDASHSPAAPAQPARQQSHSEILTEVAELTLAVMRAMLTEVEHAAKGPPLTAAAAAQYANSFTRLADTITRSIALANHIDRQLPSAHAAALQLHAKPARAAPAADPEPHPAIRPPATRH